MSRPYAPLLCFSLVALAAAAAAAQDLPDYLRDRGSGIPVSQFGTYIRAGELLVYPFYEYTENAGFEYKPSELGYEGGTDYLGTTKEHEYLLFLAYGIRDGLSIELEGALHIKATLDKAADDASAVPARLEESGLGDVESQLRWRWSRETETRPELFSFFEVVFPLQKDKVLIGTQDWEFAQGFGLIKGFSWGTLTARVAAAYEKADSKIELGEYAVEYLKRLSPRWRVFAALEGESDELSLIGELQWQFSPHGFLKLNSGFGLSEKAPDFAPEIGVMLSF